MSDFDDVCGSNRSDSPRRDVLYYRNRYKSMLADSSCPPTDKVEDVLNADAAQLKNHAAKRCRETHTPTTLPPVKKRTTQKKTEQASHLYSVTEAALAVLKQEFCKKNVRHFMKLLRLAIPPSSRLSQKLKFSGLALVGEMCTEMLTLIEHFISVGADSCSPDANGDFCLALLLHYRNCAGVVTEWINRSSSNSLSSWPLWNEFSLSDLAIALGHGDLLIRFMKMGIMPSRRTRFQPASRFVRIHGHFSEGLALLIATFWDVLDEDDLEKLTDLICHLEEIDFRNGEGKSPLFVAVERGYSLDVVRLLLEKGADPNLCDDADTPMLVFPLMRSGSESIVRLLLQFKADVHKAVDDTGQTVLQFAQDAAVSKEVVAMLTNHDNKETKT
eukprot:TRINITY_DN3905_c1_g1_i1.p2 TRINITY_DN3905_c1_g1~~TRINITY_DN3905_c1_g1_i1.p2  ORF type:complete len:387 (-),score=97.58 TRINITY_DN3905_c1_g1_i1:23-1183(-)